MADQNSNPDTKQADGASEASPPDKEGMGASGGRTGSGIGTAKTDSAGGTGRQGQGGDHERVGVEQSGEKAS